MFARISRLLTSTFARRQPGVRAVPVRLPVRGRYDAAQTNADNRRHWALADGLSAAAANSVGVRRILRNRARYEVANNSYAKGIVDTLANDVIGYGPTIQVDTGDPEANKRIKAHWEKWANEIRLASKLRTMRRSKAVDGEAFGVITTNSKLRSPIKLDLRLVEADQVTDPDGSDLSNADGIKFDDDGNVVSYSILRDHPGGGTGGTSKAEPIPARSVIHWFTAERPGQVRGVPDILPALPLFAQLRRFTLAVIAAAETAAEFAAVMYTNAPASGEADEVDPFLPIEIEQRMMLTMPAGWQMAQLKAEQPASTYAEFKKEILNEIARCLNMPFNIAACNSSSYNYSSGQLDHQTYFSAIEIDQDDIEIIGLDKLWDAWLEEAALVPGLLPDGPYGDWSHTVKYFWRSRGHADPSKIANAQHQELEDNATTLADIWARKGYDWQDKLRQRAAEKKLLKELGLTDAEALPSKSSPSTPPKKDAEEPEEEFEDAA